MDDYRQIYLRVISVMSEITKEEIKQALAFTSRMGSLSILGSKQVLETIEKLISHYEMNKKLLEAVRAYERNSKTANMFAMFEALPPTTKAKP